MNMMKITIKFFVVVACVFATFTVSAQTKATRFGYINTEELLATLPEMKKAEEELKKKQQEIEGQMASLQETYQKLLKELNEGTKTMTDLEKVSKDLEKKKNDARLKEHLYDVWQGKIHTGIHIYQIN